jgi:two-component system sensor histidine kinase KdpD
MIPRSVSRTRWFQIQGWSLAGFAGSVRRKAPAYLEATAVVLLSIGLAFLVSRFLPHANLSLVFLIGVLVVSARVGLGPSLYASVLSFQAFNYLFTPPYYTFEVADEGYVATLIFFLMVAAIAGNLGARMHREIDRRRTSFRRVSNLHAFSRQMASAARSQDIVDALASHLADSLQRPILIILAEPDAGPQVVARAGSAVPWDTSLIEKAWKERAASPFRVAGCLFLELALNDKVKGMAVIRGELENEQLELARSLCEQAAVALDRTQLVADLDQAKLVSEAEQLRSALLSSVSHDLRTPLASIIGSTTSLMEYGNALSREDQRELLGTVVEEARRLDRYIQNLLDMTRLGHGKLVLRRDWVDLHDIVASSLRRLSELLGGTPVHIQIEPTVPLLWVHGVLLEQALVNLLDNAIRFTPPGAGISVSARRVGASVEIDVCDEGPGIALVERDKIFDMFYTARQGDRCSRQGTGLGLAICRGMVGAHGGTVSVQDGTGGCGTCMRIVLPLQHPAASIGS